ncbi:hypothetical protein PP1_030990 [Pseudonocardia sp. P1]|nr:hypothetical protein Ae707Ps1_6063c [Pseudonocardia sp. Ae707_Ps1]
MPLRAALGMIIHRIVAAASLVLLASQLAGCSSEPPEYRILVTEPSSNMASDGQLFVHWSCDASVDPATRYQGHQDALWRSETAPEGASLLDTSASCPSGSLLTVQVDAAVMELTRPTQLRCEVFNADGQRAADETVSRGLGTSDPVCRVPVAR